MGRTSAQRLRRTAALTGLSFAAVASARVLLKPRAADSDRRLLDWDSVRRHAYARTGERGRREASHEQAAEYDAIARDVAPLMEAVLQMEPSGFPQFQALDRRGFIDANLEIMQRLIEPMEELRARLPESRMTAISRTVASRYIGELMGFMSHRVLGQYDPVLQLSPPMAGDPAATLFLVEPNVAHFQRTQQVPVLALRRWLILHELTHAWQFGAHPWLRDYMADQIRELMSTATLQKPGEGPTLPSSREVVSKLPQALRTQLGVVNRVQAVMSVLEGYSNFVMHRVGKEHLEHFDKLEKAFHARRRQRSLFERLVIAVTGMGMKMRQYEVGERWAAAVTDRAGLETLNRVWSGPEAMPTLAELREPERWLRRMGG